LRYVEGLKDARTLLADFFSILLEIERRVGVNGLRRDIDEALYTSDRQDNKTSCARFGDGEFSFRIG
jgi:hypothetical protein